eukprot:460183_1
MAQSVEIIAEDPDYTEVHFEGSIIEKPEQQTFKYDGADKIPLDGELRLFQKVIFDEQHIHCGAKHIKNVLILPIIIIDYLNSKQHGYRIGAEKDIENIKNTFGSNGYNYEFVKNCFKSKSIDATQYRGLITATQNKLINNNCQYDAFLCIISAHGGASGEKYSSTIFLSPDDQKVNNSRGVHIQNILNEFKNSKSGLGGLGNAFLGKPKIFIIQACRGNEDATPIISKHTHINEKIINHNSMADCGQCDGMKTLFHADDDMFILRSTTEGYPSYRTKQTGSHLIYAFCQQLAIRNSKHKSLSFNKIIDKTMCKTQQLSIAIDPNNVDEIPVIQAPEFTKTAAYDIEFINPY